MIYTGYFARTKKYEEAGLTPVSIAGVTPDFFKGPKWTAFAPRKEVFWKWKNRQISNEKYMELYIKYLGSHIEINALRKIKSISKSRDIVLCCYEKPNDFCHRHSLAAWLGDKLKEEIKEYELC